jgi:hypothetical protein
MGIRVPNRFALAILRSSSFYLIGCRSRTPAKLFRELEILNGKMRPCKLAESGLLGLGPHIDLL